MPRPFLIMMYGLTGTGKSTVARLIATSLPNTVVFHSAEIRRMLRLTPAELNESGGGYRFSLEDPVFTHVVSRSVYRKMVEAAGGAIAQGKNAILDGSFSMAWQRRLVYDLVRERDVDFCIVNCLCPDEAEIRTRIEKRKTKKDPFSEAMDFETYISLRDKGDPLSDDLEAMEFPLWIISYNTTDKSVRLQSAGRAGEAEGPSALLEALKSVLGSYDGHEGDCGDACGEGDSGV